MRLTELLFEFLTAELHLDPKRWLKSKSSSVSRISAIAVGAVGARVKPVAEPEKGMKGGWWAGLPACWF